MNTNDLRRAIVTVAAQPCDEQHYPQPSDPDKAQAALALLLDDLRMLAEEMGIDFDKALADSK